MDEGLPKGSVQLFDGFEKGNYWIWAGFDYEPLVTWANERNYKIEITGSLYDDMMIGVSVHTVQEALDAVKAGADCLGVGAMFSTSTKADADVLPMSVLKDICDAVDIPVVAIGGIGKHNIGQLAGTGVDGVALVSAIFSADDIENECRELRRLSEEMTGI